MTKPIRLGLLGCGRAAERLHAPAIRRAGGTRLTGVFDPIQSRRELIAAGEAGCRMFESAEALVGSGEVDAVIIATPVHSHVQLASLALGAGLPVLIEKPLADSLGEAGRLEALQRATGVPLMIAFNRRWWDAAGKLRHQLSKPDGPALVEMEIASDVKAWSPVSGTTDALEDLGTHQLDLLRFLFGCEIDSVRAFQPTPAEFHLAVRLENGTTARCTAAYRSRSQEIIRVSRGAERSCVRVGSDRIRPATGGVRRMLDFTDTVRRRALRGRSGLARSYDRQLRFFVDCVRGHEPASPSLQDGLAVLRAIVAARASLSRGGSAISLTSIT